MFGRGIFYLMATKDELNAKRDEARRRHKHATRKISRLNRNNGTQLSGTKYDPRRDLERLKSYNSKQLDAYISKLDTFNARSTQFIQYANRDIDPAGPGSLWYNYKKNEQKYNRRVNKAYDAVENTYLPSAYDEKGRLVDRSQTIGNRMKTTVADKRTSRGAAVNAVYDPPRRRSAAIKNRKALQILHDDMHKRVNTDTEQKLIERGQANFGKMNNTIGDDDMAAMIQALTPKQFYVLWNYTSFVEDVGIEYLQAKKMMHGDKEDALSNAEFADHLKSAKGWIKWASKLKK